MEGLSLQLPGDETGDDAGNPEGGANVVVLREIDKMKLEMKRQGADDAAVNAAVEDELGKVNALVVNFLKHLKGVTDALTEQQSTSGSCRRVSPHGISRCDRKHTPPPRSFLCDWCSHPPPSPARTRSYSPRT
jgi:hypothetical protein